MVYLRSHDLVFAASAFLTLPAATSAANTQSPSDVAVYWGEPVCDRRPLETLIDRAVGQNSHGQSAGKWAQQRLASYCTSMVTSRGAVPGPS